MQGNRELLEEHREGLEQVIVVPCSLESFVLDAELDRIVLLEEIEGNATEDSEVFCTIPLTQAGLIFSEGEVEHPMETIFDLPMRTNGRSNWSASPEREEMK